MFTFTEALQINTVFGHAPCAKASLNLFPEYLAKIWPTYGEHSVSYASETRYFDQIYAN